MGNEAQFGVDGDWSYLRAHLDKPRSLKPNTLGSGLTGWILSRWQNFAVPAPRLELVERISLGSRHALALIRADGTNLLVATSADGAASFFPLHSTQESASLASLTQPRGESVAAADSNPAAREHLPSEETSRLDRQARRHGISGRVSW
jgi:hypothetical protein